MVSQEFMTILYKQSYSNTPSTSNSLNASSSEGKPISMENHEGGLVRKGEKDDCDDSEQSAAEMGTVEIGLTIKEEVEDFSDDWNQSPSPSLVKSESALTKEVEKDIDWEPSLPHAVVKREPEIVKVYTGIQIKEEEKDYSNDREPSHPQTTVKKESSTEALSPPEVSKKDKKISSMYFPELPQQHERYEITYPRHPSKRISKKKIIFDPSHVSSFSRQKTSHEVKNKALYSSGTNDYYIEGPKVHSKVICDEVSVDNRLRDDDMTCQKCKYCGKFVKRNDYMRLHIMNHTGERPYQCNYCTNAYRTRWQLKQHLRTHTNNLPYHCPYCSYRGNRSDYLSSHVSRKHSKNSVIAVRK